jgi:hypothetical protein
MVMSYSTYRYPLFGPFLYISMFLVGICLQCHLRKGFTVAKVKPWIKNSTCGCNVVVEARSRFEYHFFSSYKSSSDTNTIHVTLVKRDRVFKSKLRLFLVSYEEVRWHLTADHPVTLNLLSVIIAIVRSEIWRLHQPYSNS